MPDPVFTGTDGVADGNGLMADPRLLRELCHDLIEPASSIRLLASAACSQLAADSSIRDQLRVIASEAAQITEICRQVLDRPGRIGPVRLDTLAAEAAARVRLRYHGEVEGDISPATVLAHPAMLTRILNNLLSNACQAAGPHGHVRIRVALDQAQARLSIADSGPGLARAKSDRASLGLEITGRLVLSCGGTLQMNVSDLGGLCVTVGLARPPQHDGRSACALADGASAIGGPAAGPMPGNGDSPR